MSLATVIEFDALWQTIWTAAVAGIGATVIFSLGVLGATRASDHRRVGQPVISLFYAALATLSAAATVGAVVWGILLITQK